jgi:hypothetical protein
MSMAIKSLVCPECQAPAVPGRYACAQCGALLASVAMTARGYAESAPAASTDPASGPARPDEQSGDAVVDHHRTPVAPAWTHALAAEPEEEALPEPSENERWDDELPVAAGVPVAAATVGAEAEGPIAAVGVPAEPKPVLRPTVKPRTRSGARSRKTDPAAIERIAPMIEQVESVPGPAVEVALEADPRPSLPTALEKTPTVEPVTLAEIVEAQPVPVASPAPGPSRARTTRSSPAEPSVTPALPAAAAAQPVAASLPFPLGEPEPAWPPPGDRGVLVEPFARVPAGTYLPPSAVLPPGEALGAATLNGRPEAAAHGFSPAASDAESPRISTADRLAQLGLPADTPRRVAGIGAVVASLGFLLPWAPVLAGSGLLGGYWSQWGLAGPGHWIVALVLVGLAVLSLAGGRLATVPVGLPAVAIATLLVGLSWPYLFGFLGRAVGIWVVLFGAILLVSGGLLDLRADRHGARDSTV